MRSLWIASGLAFALLTLAVMLRPDAAVDATAESAQSRPPQSLAAEDLSQIMSLRAQFGSAADRFGGTEASRAAFEEQLRQVAGIEASDPSPTGPTTDLSADPPAILRNAAASLDDLANRAEAAGQNAQADELRSLADQVRRLARSAAPDADDAPNSAAKEHGSLIDNGPAPQAQ